MVRRRYDAVHEHKASFTLFPSESGGTRATSIPIVMNDDALGDPMSFMAHPEHASWAEVGQANCYPDSSIHGLKIVIDIIADTITTGDVSSLTFRYGLITNAFAEDLDALDEKSGLTVKEILELQKETTDRQCYPLWTGTKLTDGSILPTPVPGLTAGQVIESVAFTNETLTDQLKYGRVRGLLRKMLPIGIRNKKFKWMFNKSQHMRITIKFLPSSVKFINPYTGLFLLIDMPQKMTSINLWERNHQHQHPANLVIDATGLNFLVTSTFFERNPEFHMAKV